MDMVIKMENQFGKVAEIGKEGSCSIFVKELDRSGEIIREKVIPTAYYEIESQIAKVTKELTKKGKGKYKRVMS